MLTTEKLTTTDVKKINKNRVFRLIHFSGKVARQEISDALRLSLPTVNQNLKYLFNEDLIEYAGNFESTGGRKAQVIMVKGSSKLAISVNITANEIVAYLVDLRGVVIDEIKLSVNIVNNDFEADIASLVNNLINKNNIIKENVLGVGITVPGIFDNDNKIILSAPTMGLKNYEVNNLTKNIDFKTIVVNDAKAYAFANYWKNKQREAAGLITVRNFDEKKLMDNDFSSVYLMLNEGVGGAFIDGETIRKGIHNRAGEFGHMTIYPGGEKCYCGKRGCYESYVSARVLSTKLGVSLDTFFRKLKEHDREYLKVFDKYLDDLAVGINNIFLMNDSNICLCGEVATYLKDYEEDLKRRLIDYCAFDTDASYLQFTTCSESEAKVGAAFMFLIDFIASI